MVRTLLVTFDTSQTGSTTAALLQAVEVGCVNRCRARTPKGVAWRPAGCLSTASKESPETGAVRVSNSQEPNVSYMRGQGWTVSCIPKEESEETSSTLMLRRPKPQALPHAP